MSEHTYYQKIIIRAGRMNGLYALMEHDIVLNYFYDTDDESIDKDCINVLRRTQDCDPS